MGYNGQFYEKFVAHTSGCSNKISDLQRATNKIDLNEYKELIDRIQEQFMKERKDPAKLDLKSGNYSIPHTKLKQVEYSVEEAKDKEETER